MTFCKPLGTANAHLWEDASPMIEGSAVKHRLPSRTSDFGKEYREDLCSTICCKHFLLK